VNSSPLAQGKEPGPILCPKEITQKAARAGETDRLTPALEAEVTTTNRMTEEEAEAVQQSLTAIERIEHDAPSFELRP
jgi:hypothetical protein